MDNENASSNITTGEVKVDAQSAQINMPTTTVPTNNIDGDKKVEVINNLTSKDVFSNAHRSGRRKIIMHVLLQCHIVLLIIALASCYTAIFENHMSAEIKDLLETIFGGTLLLEAAIIGSYVFGETFEFNKFSNSVNTIITNILGDHRRP